MFSNPTAITFTSYMILMVILGFVAWRYTRNFNDYILGGRSLGGVVTALSVGASDMSGWLLMGLPGAVFLSGITESWIAIGLTLGTYLNWKFVAARLRVYTEVSHNALTLPDFFTHRFKDDTRMLRILAAVVILVFFTIYCASGVVAGARLFENTFDMSYERASLMCVALVVTPIVVMTDLGGFSSAVEQVKAIDVNMVNMLSHQTFIGVLSLIAWGLGYFGQPHILVRFMAARSIKVIPRACRISLIWMIFCLGGAVSVGFFGSAYFAAHPDQATLVTENHERVFIVLSQVLFNPWIGGILMAAILAAVMSTLSCQLLVCSSTLTQDFYRGFIRPKANQWELLWFGRMMVLLISFVAIFIAMDPQSLVLSLVSYAWAGFGAAFGPVILISLWWKRMNKYGAMAGMFTGAATVLIWHQFNWFGLYEIVPGFLFAAIAIYVVSLLTEAPDNEICETFDKVEAEVRAG